MFEETVDVTVTGAGTIEIFTAAQPMGQSLATTFTQLAVDVFGVPADRIDVSFGDTDRGTGFGSAGSRSLFVVGSAVRVASERTVAKAHELAAQALEAAAGDIEYRDGVFSIAGTDRRIGLFDLARRQADERIVVRSTSAVGAPSWPNGCHVCEVEVDPDTGAVELDGYWSVNDVGRVVNPMVVIGQLEGGAAQGIGQALCERFVYDAESGQAQTASFMDYAIPHARDDPPLRDDDGRVRRLVSTNPMGVKGVGELGTIGATPAVVNAVVDALARNGFGRQARELQMPLTSERVWRAMQPQRHADQRQAPHRRKKHLPRRTAGAFSCKARRSRRSRLRLANDLGRLATGNKLAGLRPGFVDEVGDCLQCARNVPGRQSSLRARKLGGEAGRDAFGRSRPR